MPDQKTTDNPRKEPLINRICNHRAYPVLYMFIITFFFAIILVGVSTATRERVEANRQIRRERALLMAALPDAIDRNTPPMKVHQIFTQRVKPPEIPEQDPLYRIASEENEDEIIAYALPLEGQGFWDVIAGFLALETDQETIIGIAFHMQNETPGLGAEILSQEFREQFQGKKLAVNEKPIEFISPTEERDEHSVHAITGATQTSNRLERIIQDDVTAWRQGKTTDSDTSSE